MARIELDSKERKEDWEEVTFKSVYERLYNAKVVSTQTELANILKLGRAAVGYIAKKGYVPREWKTRFERAGLNWDWVAYGDGGKYNANYLFTTGAIISVPRVVNINDGKIEKSKETFEYPVHRSFLNQVNVASSDFGYVVQTGSAMSPSANDNDIWIVDLNNKTLDIGCTYIVKLGESAQVGARVVIDMNGIDNTVTLGHASQTLPHQVVSIPLVQVVGRCVLKVCKVV